MSGQRCSGGRTLHDHPPPAEPFNDSLAQLMVGWLDCADAAQQIGRVPLRRGIRRTMTIVATRFPVGRAVQDD